MTDRPLKLVLMGTGPFALPSFRQIARSHHTILAVVTKPPVENPSRDKAPPESPILTWARQAELQIVTPASINDPSAIVRTNPIERSARYGQSRRNQSPRVPTATPPWGRARPMVHPGR